jgi:N-acyl homoserine lactone hydrolase
MYELDILIPTARFAFSVEGDAVEVLPEHRSPEAFAAYRELRDRRPVVGMTTFPNTVLLRGPATIVVDPGLPLQNDPVLGALEARGLTTADVDLVVLTHAHLDHAGASAALAAPVAVHELETRSPHWPLAAAVLDGLPLRLLHGDGGELTPGVEWALTPGHCAGHISLRVETTGGRAVLCGDTVGPTREAFDAMQAPAGPDGQAVLRSWRRIRAWEPDLVVAGHVPPFAP